MRKKKQENIENEILYNNITVGDIVDTLPNVIRRRWQRLERFRKRRILVICRPIIKDEMRATAPGNADPLAYALYKSGFFTLIRSEHTDQNNSCTNYLDYGRSYE